jgi:hypothetical protein
MNSLKRRKGMEKFYSTEFDVPNVKTFAWYGDVLMAEKRDMQNQIIVRASGTYNVEKGEFGLHVIKLDNFPRDLNHNDFEPIGWRTDDGFCNK